LGIDLNVKAGLLLIKAKLVIRNSWWECNSQCQRVNQEVLRMKHSTTLMIEKSKVTD